MIRQAFVLGAGLGLRLRPLTDELPKPLVPIFQKPLITFALDHLLELGVETFVVNTHRLPETFARLFSTNVYRQHPLHLVHEPVLLETGGGIKNAEPFLGDQPFITYSGDVLTSADLRPLVDEHFRRVNEVTLGLRQTTLGSQIAFRDGAVIDIANTYGIAGNYDFAGIAVWSPEVLSRILPAQKTSFFPVLKKWLGEKGRIGGVVLPDGEWFNIGSVPQYLEVHQRIFERNWRPAFLGGIEWPVAMASSARAGANFRLQAGSCVGENCEIGDDVTLETSVLWPGAQIASGTVLQNCVVRPGRHASGNLRDKVL